MSFPPALLLCHIPRAGVDVEAVESAALEHGLVVRRIAAAVAVADGDGDGDGGDLVVRLAAGTNEDTLADAKRASLLEICVP